MAKKSKTNPSITSDSRAMMASSKRRYPRCSSERIPSATTAVTTPAGRRATPKTRLRPMAAPVNSATSVADATTSACNHRSTFHRAGKHSRARAGRLRCVPSPSLEVAYWTRMAMALAATTTHTRR